MNPRVAWIFQPHLYTQMTNAKTNTVAQAEALFTKPTAVRPVVVATSNYRELLAQHAALEAQIKIARDAELDGVRAQIIQLIEDYELQAEFTYTRRAERAKAQAKYRDPESGATWTGRGRAPAWMEGKDKALFLIA
jgi:DNA-binding protein H-NS